MKKLLISVLLCFSPLLVAQSIGEELQSKLNAIRSMSADFTQVVKAGHRTVSNSDGSMALERPGKFRWQTKSPMEQLVVADSNHLWIYDVDLEQVTVKKQEKGLGGTPALFLSGYDNTVTRDFDVISLNEGTYELRAKSPKESYQKLKMIFKGSELSQIEFFDQLGQHTVVKLTDVKNNPTLTPKLFQFKPPKGVDVVRQ